MDTLRDFSRSVILLAAAGMWFSVSGCAEKPAGRRAESGSGIRSGVAIDKPKAESKPDSTASAGSPEKPVVKPAGETPKVESEPSEVDTTPVLPPPQTPPAATKPPQKPPVESEEDNTPLPTDG